MNNRETRQSLLLRLRNSRDEHSWEEFVHYYQGYIYKVIFNMGVPHEDCLDLVQLILLKLWKKLDAFEPGGRARFRTWLCTIIQNRVRNFRRDRARSSARMPQSELNEDHLEVVDLPEIEAIAEREWKEYIANMAWENIRGGFSEKVCECFMLLTGGTPVPEVCQRLELSESSVYVYKKRVKDRLLREIRRLDSELGE